MRSAYRARRASAPKPPGAALVVDDAPAPQHDDVLGDGGRRVEIVGHEHDDAPGVTLGAELALQPRSARGIERRRRLVEEQELRLVQESAREREALRHAARERARLRLGRDVAQPDAREHGDGARARRGDAVELGEEREVLARREVAVEARVVAHVPDARAPRATRARA